MSLIISKNGKNAIKLDKIGFEQESDLQKYIYDNPESIPLEHIKENVTFHMIDREFPTSSGPLDVLGFDSEGSIYIIETKLFKNSDKRQVLAQVLDYGAALWNYYQDPEEFIEILKHRFSKKNNMDLLEYLESNVGNSDEIIKLVKENIVNGNINFIILMDNVPSALKHLISFMNQNSQFSIYGVELEYYTYEDYEMLIPHVFGTETKKRVVSVSKERMIDADMFLQEIEDEIGSTESEVIQKILEWAEENNFDIKYSGQSLRLEINHKNINYKPLKIYNSGLIEISFAYLKKSPPFDDDSKRLELLKHFNKVSNFNLSDDKINKRPGDGLSISMLKNEQELNKFVEALEWFLKEIHSSYN